MDNQVLGFINFDRPNIESDRVEGLITKDKAHRVSRNKFIKVINTGGSNIQFVGRILEGPFFQPEEVSRDSALAQVSILHGDKFPTIPNFYASVIIEIIGEVKGDHIVNTSIRPLPQAKIVELDFNSINALLGLNKGNLLVGNLQGYEESIVKFDSKDLSILPRNIGIFGTVGSGKTNTAQVLIEELAERENTNDDKWAVVILDVEGEYTMMDKPENQINKESVDKLEKVFNIKTSGIKDFHVLKLCNTDSMVNTADEVTIRTDQIEPDVLVEILQTPETQTAALLQIIDELKKNNVVEEEPESVIDSVRKSKRKFTYTLEDIIKRIDQEIVRKNKKEEVPATGDLLVEKRSLRPLKRRLLRLKNTGAFDSPSQDVIDLNPEDLLVRGRVTVIDLSDTGDYEKNLLTAQLLNKIFYAKQNDGRNGEKPTYPHTMIVIEEAHTFISKENKDKMVETMNMLKQIARRGRKRFLGLCFISQQPAHLPNEIFELANTRIIHCIRSANNIDVLKYSSGDITEEMWNSVPSLNPGQAIINGPQFRHSLVVEVRPSRSKRCKLQA